MEDVYQDYITEAWYVGNASNFEQWYWIVYPKEFFKNMFNTYSTLYFK
jgi:hypothetical protein